MIGSGDDVQIKLKRQNVSAHHAMLVFDDGTGKWSVTDMDSTTALCSMADPSDV